MRVGCPIRRSRDHRSLASPPGFSQRAASFLASQCQGIHQMPFSSRLITASPSPAMPHHRRAQGQAPCLAPATAEAGGLYEDTSRTRPEHLLPRPVRLGHITTLSSPFNQPPPRSPAAVSLNLLRYVAPGAFGVADATPVARSQQRCDRGGGERIRTDDLLLAKQALSQLSYTPRSAAGCRAFGSS